MVISGSLKPDRTINGDQSQHSIMMSVLFRFLILICLVAGGILPGLVSASLTEDETRFMSDLTGEGIPLLYEVPASMKAGIFHGDGDAITSIGQEQRTTLDAFVTKINEYTLSDEMDGIRTAFLGAADIYRKNLDEYVTLNASCGSCITRMNEMYPLLHAEADKVMTAVLSVYQKTQAPVQ